MAREAQVGRGTRRRKILWGVFAVVAALLAVFWLSEIRFAENEMYRESFSAMASYEISVGSYYLFILIAVLHISLCAFAWYGFIRVLLERPVLPRLGKRARAVVGVLALLFLMLTVFLLVMSIRANAEVNAALNDPTHEGYSGWSSRYWGRWSIAALLSAELFVGCAAVWLAGRKKQKLPA